MIISSTQTNQFTLLTFFSPKNPKKSSRIPLESSRHHHFSRASSSSSSRPKLFSEYINVNAEAKPRGTARGWSGPFPCRFCWKAASKKISRTCKQLSRDSKTCSCFYVGHLFLISSCSNLISSSKGLHLKNPMLKSLKCSCSVHSKKPPHVRCCKILDPNNIFGHPPSRLIPSIAVSTWLQLILNRKYTYPPCSKGVPIEPPGGYINKFGKSEDLWFSWWMSHGFNPWVLWFLGVSVILTYGISNPNLSSALSNHPDNQWLTQKTEIPNQTGSPGIWHHLRPGSTHWHNLRSKK